MASVEKVIYRNGDEEFLVTVYSYEEKYKNFLFCTSPNCNARMSHVYVNSSGYAIFRNRMYTEHSLDCPYYTDTREARKGTRKEGQVFSELSREQKKKSLKRAIDLLLMTDQEKEAQRIKRREQGAKRKIKKAEIKDTVTKPEIKIVLNKNDKNASKVDNSVKARLKPSKSCDRINDKDVGTSKTVCGFLEYIDYNKDTAIITIKVNSLSFDFRFEEAFANNSPGALGYFHYIERYMKEYKNVPFSALGDIRKKNKNDRFESAVLDAESIRITANKIPLLTLGSLYSTGQL
ncbi:hypothetical protein AAB109_29985 (plasmid) [Priestia megaterium]|uniref:hypothetical protein n=1 Tax=Priestia megaterium TaxID=1404 RepID=UPI0030F477FC